MSKPMHPNEARQIAADFGEVLQELLPSPANMYDTCYLPHSKRKIEAALQTLIENEVPEKEAARTALLFLADFQYNIEDVKDWESLRTLRKKDEERYRALLGI